MTDDSVVLSRLTAKVEKLEKLAAWCRKSIMVTFVIAFMAFAVLASHIIHDVIALGQINQVLEGMKR